MADQKPNNRERVKEIVAGIEQNIQELFQSERYFDYLRTMSRFHSYSVNNTILIHMQRPNAATPVAGFQKWKQFGRHVKKGEKGLTIIAPTPLKKKIEEMKLDPDTQAPVLDQDGNIIVEEKTIEIPLFKPVKVFSADQTDGKPLPSLVTDLTGDVQQYDAFMEALRRTSPVPVEIKPIDESMDGFFSPTAQSIAVREGMSEVQTVCATVHEIAHAVLHNKEQDRLTSAAGSTDQEPPKAKDKNTKEVEAESVSFAVCQYYGIDTSSNSIGYIASWSKDRSLPELKASLDTITKTVSGLITSIDKHFAEVCKERGIDLTAQQPEQDAPTAAPDTPEQFAADLYDYMDQLHQAGVLKHPFDLDPREQSIAGLVTEMQQGYFDSVRNPLAYLIEHTDLIKARTMLNRMNILASKMEDWERVSKNYVSDFFTRLNDLHEAGVISNPFFKGNREETESIFLSYMNEGQFDGFRRILKDAEERTHIANTADLRDRLEILSDRWDAALICKVEPVLGPETADLHSMIRTYEQRDGQLIPGKVVFTGSMAECQRVVAGLEAGTITMRQVRQPDFEPPAVPEQKLESPDGSSRTQDAPAAELPSDTPEQFISDLLDMLDRLYQAGTINRNFPPDGRDKIKENLVRTLQVDPAIVRDTLDQFIREDTGAAEAKVMLARLNGLSQGKGPEYEYAVGDEGGKDRFLLMAYQKVDGGSKLDRTMFVGDKATCNAMLEKLRTGVLHFEDFCIMKAARVSCYTTKDGAELDALVDGDDKVYLGRRDHYDNCGHYLNHDHSLIHISDNERVFNVISGSDIPYTNAQLLETGYFTQEEFEKFTALHLNGPEKETEALFLVDDAVYLHIQTCDEGWDYTLYDKDTMRQLDGGQMAILDIGGTPQDDLRSAADLIILGERKLQGISVEPVPLDVLDTLQAAEEHAAQAAAAEIQDQRESHLDELREHFAQEDAPLLDTQLDEYPLPDPQMPKSGLLAYGYEEDDLIPVGPDAAKDLYDRDFSLYIAGTSGYFNMVFEPEELDGPGIWLYAIPRGEWERSSDFQQAVAGRMQHQEDREKAFLNHSGDCFAIYQIKDDDSLRDIRFESMDWLKSKGQTVERGNYDLVYTAPLPAAENVDAALDQLWFQFNNEHPADYQHPSMSVSDIIAIRRDGVLSCHYCDSFGFQQLLDFIKPENYLKNAEMAVEDDLGMIDGIINNGPKATVAELEQQARSGQPISLTDLAGAAHREHGEKKSVLAKLNAKPHQQERKKSAPRKSAERER